MTVPVLEKSKLFKGKFKLILLEFFYNVNKLLREKF